MGGVDYEIVLENEGVFREGRIGSIGGVRELKMNARVFAAIETCRTIRLFDDGSVF